MKLQIIPSGASLTFFKTVMTLPLYLPYIESGVSAGFPSPADDFLDMSIDLNKELIRHPSATFYVRVRGDSMQNAGIHDGDLLIVDRSVEVQHKSIIVCCLNGEFTVKQLLIEANVCHLMPANERYKPIRVLPEDDFIIWGKVVHVIKSL